MRGNELLDILEHIDSDLIEGADKKRTPAWIRLTALAACLALVIGLLALLPRQTVGDPPVVLPAQTTDPTNTIKLLDHNICPEKLTGVRRLGTFFDGTSNVSADTPPAFDFQINIVVEARVIEILPDLYSYPKSGNEFRILKLETLDVITGKNMPQVFYLTLRSYLSPELDQFDSLILSIKQIGIEHYPLINETTSTIETFTHLFGVHCYYSPHFGAVMAFSSGVLDPSLWKLDGWDIGVYLEFVLDKNEYPYYVAVEGSTPDDVKENIRQEITNDSIFQEVTVYTADSYRSEETQAVFDYVAPFKNGVFIHTILSATSLRYTRLINGFPTTENILIKDGTVTYEGEAFTQKDLKCAPDIGSMIEGLDLESLVPPHTENHQTLRLLSCGARGWYVKTGGQVYGIVKLSWAFCEKDDYYLQYFDDLYYLAFSDGTYRVVEREELRAYIGDDPNISDTPYNTAIEQPYE